MTSAAGWASAPALVLVAACKTPLPPEFLAGDEVICEAPVAGFDRYVDETAARGLDHEWAGAADFGFAGVSGGGVAAEDLDDDGDIDVAFGNPHGLPHVYANDGAGHFAAVPLPDDLWPDYADHVVSHGVADLDGDGRFDLVMLSPGRVRVAWGQGDLAFSDPETWFEVADSIPVFVGFGLGDADGDGDLDLALPAVEFLDDDVQRAFAAGNDPGWGTPDRVVLQEGGGAVQSHALVPDGTPGYALMALWTDRDGDGDADLLVPSDRAQAGLPRTAFYRNDGNDAAGPVLVNDAPSVAADLRISGMGAGIMDHNGDGDLDYCMSDLGGFACLISDGSGGYVESAAALGLSVPAGVDPRLWFGWSLEIEDFDNNATLDAAVTAAVPLEIDDALLDAVFVQQDGMWEGLPSGTFVDRGGAVGFADTDQNVGMVAADFDGDGALELLRASMSGAAKLSQNRCTEGAWLQVELRGGAGNSAAIGALVEVTVGERTWTREVQGPRAMGQSPSRLHFGLGDAEEVDHIAIRWGDGSVSEAEQIPVRRRLWVDQTAQVAP